MNINCIRIPVLIVIISMSSGSFAAKKSNELCDIGDMLSKLSTGNGRSGAAVTFWKNTDKKSIDKLLKAFNRSPKEKLDISLLGPNTAKITVRCKKSKKTFTFKCSSFVSSPLVKCEESS